MEKYSMTCSAEVREMTTISRSKLDLANVYVRKALECRKEGNLLSARKNMQSALKVYPKYYWVQELLKSIEVSIEKQRAALQNEALLPESKGKQKEARILSPQREELKSEAARLQTGTRTANKEDNTLSPSEEAEKVSPVEDTSEYLGKQGEKVENEVYGHRLDIIRQGLDAAQKAEQNGELEEAAQHMLKTLELSSPGEPLTKEIVEYARLLGMKFFSIGNFSRAKVLWQDALKLSPGNRELQQYLKEVEAGLDSLQRIKKEEGQQSQSFK